MVRTDRAGQKAQRILEENSQGKGSTLSLEGIHFSTFLLLCISGVMEGVWAPLGPDIAGLGSWLCHLLAVRPSLDRSLSHVACFFICQMGILPSLQGC